MHGDYYYQTEVAEKLGLRMMQLQGMLYDASFRALFENRFIAKVDCLNRTIQRKTLMLHKDNLNLLRATIAEKRQFHKVTRKKLMYGWTESAKDCYAIGCKCHLCSVYPILGERCKMKEKIQILLSEQSKRNEEDKKRAMQHGTDTTSKGYDDSGNDIEIQKDTVCVGL